MVYALAHFMLLPVNSISLLLFIVIITMSFRRVLSVRAKPSYGIFLERKGGGMLYWRVAKVVSFLVMVLCNNAFADSPVVTKQSVASVSKSAVTSPVFVYPTNTTLPHEYIETGVLFVYNEHILDYFDGDIQKLTQFIDASIEHNNQAFVNSNIPIKRVVTGLLYLSADDIWSANDAYTDRLHALAAWQQTSTGQKLKTQYQYSYLVSLAGYASSQNETTMLGQAFVGDNVSWISPYSKSSDSWLERTLAHELGHNDGFKHSSEGAADEGAHIARFDAAGYQCGAHSSIMHISGLRIEPFFSDAHINLTDKNTDIICGQVGQANSAQVYRDFARTNVPNAKATFSNLLPTRPKSGVVSMHTNAVSVTKDQNITIEVIFEGADGGDSVNLIMQNGTASMRDYQHQIISIVHDGLHDVYAVTVPTYTANINQDTEFSSYELRYPNGVTIDDENASITVTIIDNSNTDSQAPQPSLNAGQAQQPVLDNTSVSAAAPNTSNLVVSVSNDESRSGGSVSGMLILLLWLVTSARLITRHGC